MASWGCAEEEEEEEGATRLSQNEGGPALPIGFFSPSQTGLKGEILAGGRRPPTGSGKPRQWEAATVERDSRASLMPFAKQSKMVSRYQQKTEVEASISEFSKVSLWDRLTQQPNLQWMEGYHEAPSLLTSGCIVGRPAVAEGDLLPCQVISTLQKLPSPKELCQRKKKKGQKRRRPDTTALSVCYHLEDLKQRQNSIDELKRAKWGVRVSQPVSESAEGRGDSLRQITSHEDFLTPFTVLRPPAQLYGENSGSRRHSNTQLLYPEWKPAVRDQLMIPRESPVISYTMATQSRCPVPEGGLPEEGFWASTLLPEE